MEERRGGNRPCDAPCFRCGAPVREDAEFCRECGTVTAEGIKCCIHLREEAGGVCVICSLPYCAACGSFLQGVFFCANHARPASPQ